MTNAKTASLGLALALSLSSAFASEKPIYNSGKDVKVTLVGEDAKNLKALLDGVSPRGQSGDDLYYFYTNPLPVSAEAKWSLSCSMKAGVDECQAAFAKDLVEDSAGQSFLMNAKGGLGSSYGYSDTLAKLQSNAAVNPQATVSGESVTFTSKDGQFAFVCTTKDCGFGVLKAKGAPGRYGDLAIHTWGHKALTGVVPQDRRMVTDLTNDADVAALLLQLKTKYAIEPVVEESGSRTTSSYVLELTPEMNHTNVLACSETTENGRMVERRCRIRVVSYFVSNLDGWDPTKNAIVANPFLFSMSATGAKYAFKSKDGQFDIDCFPKKFGYCRFSFVKAAR
ncbi:MAG: hypothetical protein JST04_00555 [Bdellovibrionales bacterium]|nr:hypothetical protein [Bdellovibrionales bacterium]